MTNSIREECVFMETSITHKRAFNNPHLGFSIRDNCGMKNQSKLMDYLADNLKKLMDSHDTLKTDKAIEEKSHVGRSTVQRIRAREGTTTLDKVEKIAAAFEVSAADLLSEGGRVAETPDRSARVEDIVELITLFNQATEGGRNQILVAAHRAKKRESAGLATNEGHSAND
jgi:transcriptional regulator with XRE-family HTH domain